MLNIVSSLFSRREPVELIRVKKPTTIDVLRLSERNILSMGLGEFADKLELFSSFPEAFMGYRKGDRLFYVPYQHDFFSEDELASLREKNIVPKDVFLDICLMESSPQPAIISSIELLREKQAFYHHYPLVDESNNIQYFANIPRKRISKALEVDSSRFYEKYGEALIDERMKNRSEEKVVPLNP